MPTWRYQDIVIGKGVEGESGKMWHMKYKGWRAADGVVFDSWENNRRPEMKDGKPVTGPDGKPVMGEPQPLAFPQGAGRLIPGFDWAVAGMHVGGKRRIFIPWELAYGTRAMPDRPDHPGIPAKSDLIFDVELVDVTDMPAMPQRPMMPQPPHGAPGAPGVPGQPPKPGTAPPAALPELAATDPNSARGRHNRDSAPPRLLRAVSRIPAHSPNPNRRLRPPLHKSSVGQIYEEQPGSRSAIRAALSDPCLFPAPCLPVPCLLRYARTSSVHLASLRGAVRYSVGKANRLPDKDCSDMTLDRRDFLAACSRAGISSALLPGILYTLASQSAEAQQELVKGPSGHAPAYDKITPGNAGPGRAACRRGPVHRCAKEDDARWPEPPARRLRADSRTKYAQLGCARVRVSPPDGGEGCHAAECR